MDDLQIQMEPLQTEQEQLIDDQQQGEENLRVKDEKEIEQQQQREEKNKQKMKELQQIKRKKEEQRLAKQREKQRKRLILEKRRRAQFMEKVDEEDKKNKVYRGDETFQGPKKKRKYTDWYMIIVFLVLNGVFALTAVICFLDSDVNRLIHGMDFRQEICGTDKYADKPYLYYIHPEVDINIAICVEQCPDSFGPDICLYKEDGKTYTSFCYTQMQTELFGKHCLPIEANNRNLVDSYLSRFHQFVQNLASDLEICKELIFEFLFMNILLSFGLFSLLQIWQSIKAIVYISLSLVIACFGGFSFICYIEYYRVLDRQCKERETNLSLCGGWQAKCFYYLFIIWIVLGGLYILRLFLRRKNIPAAIAIMINASRCTQVFRQIRIVPILIGVLSLVICGIIMATLFMAFSLGEIKVIEARSFISFLIAFLILIKDIDGEKVKTLEYTDWMRGLMIYDFLIFIYWILIMSGLQDLIIAYCFSLWYFTKRKDTVQIPLWLVIKNVFKYHLGTIFLISFTSTFLSPVKLVLEKLRKYLSNEKRQHSNLFRYLQFVLHIPLILHQKFLRYISRCAYIQVAIFSEKFYKASKKAFFLQFRNQSILFNMDELQSWINQEIRLIVTVIPALGIYAFCIFYDKTLFPIRELDVLTTPLTPMIACFIGGFVFSMIFVGSFDIAVKSIMMCYLMDSEMFVGEQRYAQQFIREFMDYFAQQSKQIIQVKSSQQVKGREANEDDQQEEEEEEQDEDEEEESEYESEYEYEDEEDEDYEDEDEDYEDEDEEDEEEEEQEEEEEEEEEQEEEEIQDEEQNQEIDQQQQQEEEEAEEKENDDDIEEVQLGENQEEQQQEENDDEAQGEVWGEERKMLNTENDRSHFEELMVQSASHLSSRVLSRQSEGQEPAGFFQQFQQNQDESINFEEEA